MNNQQVPESNPNLPPEEKSSFNVDGSGIVFGYCLKHGYSDVLFLDDEGQEFHNHWATEEVVEIVECYGGFVYCAPPPPLTEEEWNNIFEQEAL
jgi:hypothetical protein